MKTIGLIGGMSWESSLEYYRMINTAVKEKLGGLNSAKILMFSVNFAEVEAHMSKGEWHKVSMLIIDAAKRLESAGADAVFICTNTIHKVYQEVESSISVPLIHIADTAAQEVKRFGMKKVGLLGTRFTMEQDFYIDRLRRNGLEVIVPESDIDTVHRIIFDELVLGKILPESKKAYLDIISNLKMEGAEGIILGCTEIGLLIKQTDSPVPMFDTAYIHAMAAADILVSC